MTLVEDQKKISLLTVNTQHDTFLEVLSSYDSKTVLYARQYGTGLGIHSFYFS